MLLGSVILYNLGSLPYMERYRDMATLKVLAFTTTQFDGPAESLACSPWRCHRAACLPASKFDESRHNP